MILQTSLAAALLAASSGTVPQDDILALLPTDGPLVIAFGDIASFLAAEEPPAWIALFNDERVRDGLLAVTELEDDMDSDSLGAGMSVLRCIRAGGIGGTDLDSETGVAILRVTEGFVPAMQAFGASLGLELAEVEILGRRGFRAVSEDTEALSMVEVSGLFVLSFGNSDVVDECLGAVISSMEDGPDGEGWWATTGTARVESPLVELFADLDLLADDEEFTSIFPAAENAYFGVGIGAGEEGSVSFTMNLGENDLLELLAPALGEADVELLRLAPPEAMSAAVINVDFNTLIDAGLTLSESPEVRQQYNEGLEAGSAALGMDLEEEIFGNLSGDILMVQWPGGELAFADDDPAAALDAAPALVIRIDDSGPFYTLIETAEGLMGPDGLETEDIVGGSIWRTEAIPGVSVAAGLSDTMLFLGATVRVEEMMGRAAGADGEGMLDDEQYAYVRETLSGAYVAVTDLARSWEFALSAVRSEEDMPREMIELFEVASEYLSGLALGEFRLGATEFGLQIITR